MILGELGRGTSPGTRHTPLVGADLTLAAGAGPACRCSPTSSTRSSTMSGEAEVDGVRLAPGSLLYLGAGRDDCPCGPTRSSAAAAGRRARSSEKIVMWWNFVGRTGEEIARPASGAGRADGRGEATWRSRRAGSLAFWPCPSPAVTGSQGPALAVLLLPSTRVRPCGRDPVIMFSAMKTLG